MTQSVPLLVVEDEALLLLDVQDGLEGAGYAVLGAASGREALALMDIHLDSIRALVTDIDIGSDSITGWDLAQRAREAKPHLPVIYMTGASADQWTSRGVPHSVLLHKPFASAQLITAVSQLLNSSTDIAAGPGTE
ncbi:response regulator [Phreatobacter cathodiphilus]|uniref:Response regulator n=2 Tax=Phreatobacter cathodiphilus TaxID=1868589 RepID=A0A2S0NE27_9HYPH|nr:response regulator [Phreatobacter cathodiphilus]